jgi:hypothetical protein
MTARVRDAPGNRFADVARDRERERAAAAEGFRVAQPLQKPMFDDLAIWRTSH